MGGGGARGRLGSLPDRHGLIILSYSCHRSFVQVTKDFWWACISLLLQSVSRGKCLCDPSRPREPSKTNSPYDIVTLLSNNQDDSTTNWRAWNHPDLCLRVFPVFLHQSVHALCTAMVSTLRQQSYLFLNATVACIIPCLVISAQCPVHTLHAENCRDAIRGLLLIEERDMSNAKTTKRR